MPCSPKIIQLHELLAARGLATKPLAEERLAVGWPALDAALDPASGGGLPKGDIAELHCARQGGALAIAEVLQAAHRARRFLALIDGMDGFDPASTGPAALAGLLWVRCHSAVQAVQAADLLLRDGNLPLVLMNLRGCADSARVPGQAWYRLQRLVEQSGVALLVLTSWPMIPSARLRIGLNHAFTLEDLDAERAALAGRLTFTSSKAAGATRGMPGRRNQASAEEAVLAEVG